MKRKKLEESVRRVLKERLSPEQKFGPKLKVWRELGYALDLAMDEEMISLQDFQEIEKFLKQKFRINVDFPIPGGIKT